MFFIPGFSFLFFFFLPNILIRLGFYVFSLSWNAVKSRIMPGRQMTMFMPFLLRRRCLCVWHLWVWYIIDLTISTWRISWRAHDRWVMAVCAVFRFRAYRRWTRCENCCGGKASISVDFSIGAVRDDVMRLEVEFGDTCFRVCNSYVGCDWNFLNFHRLLFIQTV